MMICKRLTCSASFSVCSAAPLLSPAAPLVLRPSAPCSTPQARLTQCARPRRARYLNEKYPDSRSGLVGGAAGKTFWRLGDIELPEGGLSFLKVGDGSNIRSYASCCGTLFNTAGGAQFPIGGRPLTRNNVKHADGSPYCPPASECHDGLTKFAFDDYEIPEGAYETGPPAVGEGFKAIGPVDDASKYDDRWFKTGDDVEESVPITWEDANM